VTSGTDSVPVSATEERLRLALEAGDLGTWDVNLATGLRVWSPRAAALLGLPAREVTLTAEEWAARVHPEDRARVIAYYKAAIRSPAIRYEVEYRVAPPLARWVQSRAVMLRDAAGRATRVVGVVRDVTARREGVAELESLVAERTAALVQREAEYRTLYHRAPAAMYSVGADGLIVQVSDEWVLFLGHDDMLGRSLSELMDEESRHRYLHVELPRLHRTPDGVREAEYRIRRRSGEWVEVVVRARPERDAAGNFIRSLSVLLDVTARNRAEAALRQAQKVEALGQLTGGVAHDFNNMLQVVSGALRGLERHLPDSPPPRRLLAAAQEGAARSARLTQQLLAFARRGRLEPEVVHVNARIAGFAEGLLGRALGPRAELRLRLAPDGWSALVDPTQLEVALLNLVVNARDAMPGDRARGLVTVETANVRLGEGEPPADLPPGDYVLVTVRDDGIGMDRETLARATEPFFTTKEVGKGTGLGLSQVYGFARQSEGAMRLQSSPGEGTSVELYLPRAGATGDVAKL